MAVGSAVEAAFATHAGGRPDGVWSAPGRANLIGEHLDYNGGVVVPFALAMRTRAAVRQTSDGRLRCWSLQAEPASETSLDEPESATGWARYVAGAMAVLREMGCRIGGLEVVVDSDVPVGGGLSSSAALTCSVGLAVTELAGPDMDRMALARACRRVEAEFAGAPVGLMDPVACLLGRAGHVVELDTAAETSRLRSLPLAGTATALLLVDTGTRHEIAGGEYADRRRTCERAAGLLGTTALAAATLPSLRALEPEPLLLRRARHVVTEQARADAALQCIAGGDMATLGELMTASHVSLRDDFEVSSNDLDETVAAAVDAGALGGRLTGGGFGGCVLVLCPEDAVAAVREAVTGRAARRGAPRPVVFDAAPADGAARDC